ncbi:maleate cis-trans isomerase family protein [Roseateles violae]|uniref:Maleate isomerase n=1 Tax=Roseateles violae TaxID=3058042 RepID=A0ABT8DTB5_9BURK|nr:hypothetical protein [Pelomonas sp. PFR6]MDN3920293.1 hypothetical protein [Pelomonas sp. PFR6]
MSVEYASRGLIGLLTPQANTTVEPEFSIMMPPGYAHINARLVSAQKTIEERLLDYLRIADRTTEQFANAPIQALALGCTGASYLAGAEEEDRLLARLSALRGVPAFTAASAVVDCLSRMGARRIALATPYPKALTEASVGYWESRGLSVVAEVSSALDHAQFHPIYSLRAQAAGQLLERLAPLEGIDAVVMLGTGMPTLGPLLQANRRPGQVPVLSCMLCLAWKAVELIEPGRFPIDGWLKGTHWAQRLHSAVED